MDDPFMYAVKWAVAIVVLFACIVVTAQSLHHATSIEREAIRRNLATYDEQGYFAWKDQE